MQNLAWPLWAGAQSGRWRFLALLFFQHGANWFVAFNTIVYAVCVRECNVVFIFVLAANKHEWEKLNFPIIRRLCQLATTAAAAALARLLAGEWRSCWAPAVEIKSFRSARKPAAPVLLPARNTYVYIHIYVCIRMYNNNFLCIFLHCYCMWYACTVHVPLTCALYKYRRVCTYVNVLALRLVKILFYMCEVCYFRLV